MSGGRGSCPRCGGRLLADRRAGVSLLACETCGSAVLDAATLTALLPEERRATPPPPEHGYPAHYPQQDLGHVASRPRPPFAPLWALGPTHPSPDAGGLLRD